MIKLKVGNVEVIFDKIERNNLGAGI